MSRSCPRSRSSSVATWPARRNQPATIPAARAASPMRRTMVVVMAILAAPSAIDGHDLDLHPVAPRRGIDPGPGGDEHAVAHLDDRAGPQDRQLRVERLPVRERRRRPCRNSRCRRRRWSRSGRRSTATRTGRRRKRGPAAPPCPASRRRGRPSRPRRSPRMRETVEPADHAHDVADREGRQAEALPDPTRGIPEEGEPVGLDRLPEQGDRVVPGVGEILRGALQEDLERLQDDDGRRPHGRAGQHRSASPRPAPSSGGRTRRRWGVVAVHRDRPARDGHPERRGAPGEHVPFQRDPVPGVAKIHGDHADPVSARSVRRVPAPPTASRYPRTSTISPFAMPVAGQSILPPDGRPA